MRDLDKVSFATGNTFFSRPQHMACNPTKVESFLVSFISLVVEFCVAK